jgi:hypothetical protein
MMIANEAVNCFEIVPYNYVAATFFEACCTITLQQATQKSLTGQKMPFYSRAISQ